MQYIFVICSMLISKLLPQGAFEVQLKSLLKSLFLQCSSLHFWSACVFEVDDT